VAGILLAVAMGGSRSLEVLKARLGAEWVVRGTNAGCLSVSQTARWLVLVAHSFAVGRRRELVPVEGHMDLMQMLAAVSVAVGAAHRPEAP
jgi:hypothetical protein